MILLVIIVAIVGVGIWWLGRPLSEADQRKFDALEAARARGKRMTVNDFREAARSPPKVQAQAEPQRWGRRVTISPAELAQLQVTTSSAILDFVFPEGTTKKIHSGGTGTWPTVDLHQMTCTCENFQETGSGMPRGTPKRLCRHIQRYLLEQLPEDQHGCLEGLADDSYRKTLDEVREVHVNGTLLCWVGLSAAPFLSVYAHGRRPGDRSPPGTGRVKAYRLSKNGDRWAYGETPFGAGRIKAALAALGYWTPS